MDEPGTRFWRYQNGKSTAVSCSGLFRSLVGFVPLRRNLPRTRMTLWGGPCVFVVLFWRQANYGLDCPTQLGGTADLHIHFLTCWHVGLLIQASSHQGAHNRRGRMLRRQLWETPLAHWQNVTLSGRWRIPLFGANRNWVAAVMHQTCVWITRSSTIRAAQVV